MDDTAGVFLKYRDDIERLRTFGTEKIVISED